MNTKNKKKLNNTAKIERMSDGERLSKIALTGEIVFHAGDLSNLWNIHNENSLYKMLSRYVKRKLIFRIYKGFYSMKKVNELDPYFLGIKSLHRPAYVSCESILYEYGILNQRSQVVTLVSSISKSFSILKIRYISRQMKDEHLFNDSGILVTGGVRKASLERAVADMMYFNSKKYFDSSNSQLIDWALVKKIIKDVGYQIKL